MWNASCRGSKESSRDTLCAFNKGEVKNLNTLMTVVAINDNSHAKLTLLCIIF